MKTIYALVLCLAMCLAMCMTLSTSVAFADVTLSFNSDMSPPYVHGTLQRNAQLSIHYDIDRIYNIIDHMLHDPNHPSELGTCKREIQTSGCHSPTFMSSTYFSDKFLMHIRFHSSGPFTALRVLMDDLSMTIPQDADRIEIYFELNPYTVNSYHVRGDADQTPFTQPVSFPVYDSNFAQNFVFAVQ